MHKLKLIKLILALPIVLSVTSVKAEEVSPIIESTLKSIERSSKGLQQNMTQENCKQADCADCLKGHNDLRYMECNAKNSYIEDELQQLQGQSPFLNSLIAKASAQKSIIKPFCIRLGMDARFSEKSRSFKYCGAADKRPHKSQFRPCVTEKYFTMVSNSFDLVSRCMKKYLSPDSNEDQQNQNVLNVYSLINVESGFHINAMSSTGSGGIGQFTSSAISELNKNEIKDVQAYLQQAAPECQQLAQEVMTRTPPMQHQKSNSCDRIALSKGNPALSMIYTYAYAARAKKEIMNRLSTSRMSKKFNLSTQDLDKLSMHLAMWSHNAGIAGVMKPLLVTMNLNYPKGKEITDVDQFLKQMKSQMSEYPHPTNASEGRRRETSNYYPSIQSTLKTIENSVEGNSCLNK